VTVARLHQYKGHFHALAAIHQAKKSGLVVHYTMAGDGPYRDAITSRIEELGLEAETTLMGTVSEADVFQLLSRADTLVLPSVGGLGEAWPVSVMEAMSAGLPVIASIIGATPEMITDGIDGFLVPQGAEEALLEIVTRLHNDHDLRRKIGAEARRTARRRFDVELTAKALLNAICE
jgi:glycosyltransferase involved in cell wall biosynthesis